MNIAFTRYDASLPGLFQEISKILKKYVMCCKCLIVKDI